MKEAFIQALSSRVYSSEGIKNANKYAVGRGLNPEKFPFPWTITSSDINQFEDFRRYYPPNIFNDTLYIPLIDVEDVTGTRLIGFETRYLGSSERRTRYMKFKSNTPPILLYNFFEALNKSSTEPLVLVEGAIDCESIKSIGFNCLSSLTTQWSIKFLFLLASLSNKVLVMFDNDSPGQKATERLMKETSLDKDFSNLFIPISYRGKDPNDSIMKFGPDYLKEIISSY